MGTALIFGSQGQDSFYLTRVLKESGIDVIGVSRSGGDMTGSVANRSFVDGLVRQFRPDYVFHFAANSTTQHDALFENQQTIGTGTLNILESVRLHSPDAKVFLSGTAMQFKNRGTPINEQTAFEASSPYAVSRIESVYAGRYFRSAFGLNVYVGYFFNHDSPLRPERHINQKIAKAVQRIAAGSDEILELGSMEVQKEFNFAGDVVDAVWTLLNQDKVHEAVIGSGKAYRIGEWVEYCFRERNLDYRNHVSTTGDFIPEYDVLVSDPRLIRSLGWQPKVDIFQLANVMMMQS